MKRVLIVSPHFPPINAPDMQRVRMSLPYYRNCGWDAVVLKVDADYVDGVREPELLSTIPDDVRIVRVPAIPLSWARWVGIGNLGLRAWFPLLFAGGRLLWRERYDVVFFSTTQFNVLLLGGIWLRLFGVPYVIDIQDPWRTDYYERPGSRRPPGGWKYQFARLQAWLFESWSFRGASAVMSVSSSYLAELRARYPFFSTIPAQVIRFGTSREDLAKAKAIPRPAHAYDRSNGELHFIYTGASGPVMPHSLTVLFNGLKLYRERAPARAARLRFHFLGTSYVSAGKGVDSVMPIAAQCGVADQVEEIPHRLGHLECLRLQSEADVLLLPGSSDLAYSPSKAYPYYLTGRPILGLVFEGSVMEALLDELSCAYLIRFRELGPKEAAHVKIGCFFDLAFDGFKSGDLPRRQDAKFDQSFLAESLTAAQCQLLKRATESAPAIV